MRYLLLVTSIAAFIATVIQTYNYTVVRHDLEAMEVQRDKWRSAAVNLAQQRFNEQMVCDGGDIPCRIDQGRILNPVAPNVEGP